MRRGENPSEVLNWRQRSNRQPKRHEVAARSSDYFHLRSPRSGSEHTTHRFPNAVGRVNDRSHRHFLFSGQRTSGSVDGSNDTLSLLFAFICMRQAGIPANLSSLGALDFGIIVDGTLVMVEHIVRRLELQPQMDKEWARNETVEESVREAALEVERPIFFSLLILISAYLPLFTLERVERRLFTPMAFTVCSALIGSMLLTLTIIPVLATYIFRRGRNGWENPLLGWVFRRYDSLLQRTIPRSGRVVAFSFAVVAAAFLLSTFLGSEFLPQLDEGVIWIRANLPPGTSLAKSAEIASDMRNLIRRSPEVKLVSSQTGRNDSGTDPFGPNRNEMLVALKPYDEWRGKNKAQLVDELSKRLETHIPGATLNFTQPIIDTVTESVTGSSADLAVIIVGNDLSELRRLAARTLDAVRTVPGAADTAIEQESDQAQLRILIDRQKLARYGINVEDIDNLIELAIGGKPASTMFEGERRFDITVRYIPEARTDITDLANILVHTPDGGRVPLSELAELRVVNGASIIARRENQRQITVRTNIRGRDQGSFVADAQRRFKENVNLPSGYTVEWGGQFENLERARNRLMVILPITIALIFALLFFAFGSTTYAGIVLMNVPFSLVGGIVALWLRGIHLSVSAAVGFISLFGVAVMSGVLVVAAINQERQRMAGGLLDAVTRGSVSQVRPVLMMVLAALLGMVPAATAVGIGSDIQRPLATVVVGGLMSTLLLTLLALPSMYYLIERRRGANP